MFYGKDCIGRWGSDLEYMLCLCSYQVREPVIGFESG